MNKQLLEQNFLVLREFIPQEDAKRLGIKFKEDCEKVNFPGDTQAENSHSVYNYKDALELLCNSTNSVSHIIEEPVLPTYTYGRIYKENSVLKKHTDRPACEVSVTLHLDGDHVWPIWVKNQSGRSHCVELNPGDALLYLGCIAPHWRDEFDGTWYAQFFMHYVRANGPAAECYFDVEQIEGVRKNQIIDSLIDESVNKTPIPRHLTNRYLNGILLSNRDTREIPNTEQITEQIDHEEDEEMNFTEEKSILQILEEKKNRIRGNSNQVEESKPIESAFVRFDKGVELKKESNSSSKKLDDYIRVYENALSDRVCDDILNEYITTDDWSHAMTGGGLDQNARNCDVIGTSNREIMDRNFNYRKMLDEKIYNCVNSCMKKYESDCVSKEGLSISQDTGYELLRYREGQFYVQHTDHFKQNPRVLSCSICLNDDYEGGEFAFFNRSIKIKPKKGTVIMFPSSFMFPHEVMPITKGNRYAIITWLV